MASPARIHSATLRIEIRITEEEKAIIKDQANSASLTMSEYIRRTALGKRILSTMDQKAAGELARLGGLQKYLLTQIKDLPNEEGLRKGLNSTLLAVHIQDHSGRIDGSSGPLIALGELASWGNSLKVKLGQAYSGSESACSRANPLSCNYIYPRWGGHCGKLSQPLNIADLKHSTAAIHIKQFLFV